MPQYLMSVWHDDDYDASTSPAPRPSAWSPRSAPSTTSSSAAGAWVFAAASTPPRRPPSCAPTGGEVSMTDGPYAESKEQMGGFWVIEAADLDAALEWAAQGRRRLRGPGRGPPVPEMS